jgi:hypothetical protein
MASLLDEPATSSGPDHTRQENFVPMRQLCLEGGPRLDAVDIIAAHFGLPRSWIRSIEVQTDICHFGLFVLSLRTRRDG